MKFKIDRFFNSYFLILTNIAIIIAALTIKNGLFFYETGIIHFIAIFFVALSILRIFYHYYTYDPFLEKFIHASLFSLFIFTASHVIEFINLMILKRYDDGVFATTVNLYLIGILSIITGIGLFLEFDYPKHVKILRTISFVLIAILSVITIMLFVNKEMISFDPGSPMTYIYGVISLIIGYLSVFELEKIKKSAFATKKFADYLEISIILILIAALSNIFYELIEKEFGLPGHIIIYFSHFSFYAALSVTFLSFVKLSKMGGIFDDLRKMEENQK